MRKKSRIIILVILLLMLIADVSILLIYYLDHKQTKKPVEIVEDVAEDQTTEINIDSSQSHQLDQLNSLIGGTSIIDEDTEKIFRVNKKIYELNTQNSDCVGWLTIPDTVIDYPVMFTPTDAQEYSHKSFDGNYSFAGCLFVDKFCIPCGENRTTNVIIYGHNMRTGDMFHSLLNYEDKSFYDNHKIISLTTITGKEDYEVFAAFRTDASDSLYGFIDAKDELRYDSFISKCKSATSYSTCDVAYGTDIITLSTCCYHVNNGRFVVLAKKI